MKFYPTYSNKKNPKTARDLCHWSLFPSDPANERALDSLHAYLNFACLQCCQCIWGPIMFLGLAVSEYDDAMIGQSLQWYKLHQAKLINKVNKVSLAQVGKKPHFPFPSTTGEKNLCYVQNVFLFSG